MWVIAFFGMATIYAEATLAIETRQKAPSGEFLGGPVYYIRTAFKGGFGRFLAGFFAVAITLALGFLRLHGTVKLHRSYYLAQRLGVPGWTVGVVLVILCGFIFLGGTKRLASVYRRKSYQ